MTICASKQKEQAVGDMEACGELRVYGGLAKGTTVKWMAQRSKDNDGGMHENAAEKSVSDLKSVLGNIGSSILPRQVPIMVGEKGLLAFQIDIEIPSTLGSEPDNHVSFHG